MKNPFIVLVTAIALMFVACNSSSDKIDSTQSESSKQIFNLDTMTLKSGDTFYQCEMHSEVLSDKSGNCPKCGMELSEMKKY